MARPLTAEREALINQIIAASRYADADQIIKEALRQMAEREQQLVELRAKLRVGFEQIERGETLPFTPEWSAERVRVAHERAAAGDKPSPDIRP